MGNGAPGPGGPLGEGHSNSVHGQSHAAPGSVPEAEQRGGLVGRKLEGYQLGRLIGAGGMADVYRADDLAHGREVAVKVLSGPLAADPNYVARFRTEAKRAAALHDAHLVPVYAFEEEVLDGKRLLYLVTPLMRESLRDLLAREGRLQHIAAVQTALQVAQGLGAAHAMGLIHRDVKPENVLLDGEGHAMLGDFGIAREISDTPRRITTLASTGLPVGTPEYMAPEQLRGGSVDQRADVYALGAVLYEMLTGIVPFTGETPYDVASKVISAPLLPPSVQVLSVPPMLERVVLIAMARDPADRFSTAAEMEHALRQALTAPSKGPSLVGAVRPLWEQRTQVITIASDGPIRVARLPESRRMRTVLALAIVATLVAASAGALLVTLRPLSPSSAQQISSATRSASAGKATATRVRPTATPTKKPTPTRTASPTPQPTQTPNATVLHGSILSVDSRRGTSSYRLTNGAVTTVMTNAQTQFTGSAHRLSSLRPGWSADVTGHYQANGTFLATRVDSSRFR